MMETGKKTYVAEYGKRAICHRQMRNFRADLVWQFLVQGIEIHLQDPYKRKVFDPSWKKKVARVSRDRSNEKNWRYRT